MEQSESNLAIGDPARVAPGRVVLRTARFEWLVLLAMPRLCRQATSEWIDDNVPRLGAAVAFYTLLSLAPFLILATAAAALVYGQAAAEGRLALEIQGLVGPEVAQIVQAIVKGAYQPKTGMLATALGVVTLLVGTTSVFVELHDAMNTIWRVVLPPHRTTFAAVRRLLRDRFYSFTTVLGAGLLLLVALGLNAWIAALGIPAPRVSGFLMSYVVMAVLFAALYKTVPDVRLQWSDVTLGAGLAALLFMLGKYLMELYFRHAGFGATYVAAGSPVVVLLWMYYSAQIFFWGAEFGKVYKNVGTRLHRELQEHQYGKS